MLRLRGPRASSVTGMADPSTESAKALAQIPQAKGIQPLRPPRWGFFKGFITGAAVEIPAIASAVWVLAHWFGLGDPAVPFMRIVRLTAIFAGIAAVFTAGGIGRLAAYASVEGGRLRAMWVAGRAHAFAGVGLVVIAAIPHGHFTDRSWHWLAYPIVGLVTGGLCGALIGAVCGGAAPVGISDVFALARRPTGAVARLLAPEDLVKLGNALRQRTSHLFEGMFDPADKPPEDTKPDDKPKDRS